MDLYFILVAAVGILLISAGAMLLTRRKIMLSRRYDMLFVIVLPLLSQANGIHDLPFGFVLLYTAVFSGIVIVALYFMKDRYTIFNIKKEMFESALTAVLAELRLSYETTKEGVLFPAYENRKITYKQSLNSVEVNYRNIAAFAFYAKIRDGVFSKVKQNDLPVFPSMGLFLIAMGAVLVYISMFFRTA